MQLHNTAEGHEHKMTAVHPVWSASSSNVVSDNRSSLDTYGRVKHWWPSQAYHCTFCTRVFRTAQALGGHMNIHRRERASANDVGMNNLSRPATTLYEPGRFSPPSVEPGRPLFGATHRLLMTRVTPAATNSTAPASMSYMGTCYTSRRLPCQPPAANYNVSTHLVTAKFAPILADTNYLTEQAPHADCNGGYGKLEVAKQECQPIYEDTGAANSNNTATNISDPLTWLFSQLPPPGTRNPLQQAHTACRSNILMQRNLTKPYHRALAVAKAPPGARRHVCRLSQLPVQQVQYTGMQGRNRVAEGGGGGGGVGSRTDEGEAGAISNESLDLELRL